MAQMNGCPRAAGEPRKRGPYRVRDRTRLTGPLALSYTRSRSYHGAMTRPLPILAMLMTALLASHHLPASAQSLPDEIHPALASEACGMEDALTIDAGDIRGPGELASRIAGAGAQAVIIAGGRFDGKDFASFAEAFAGSCFYRTQMPRTDWRDADMAGTRFIATDLHGADLRGAKLDGVQFIGVDLSEARLARASLVRARWIGEYWTSNLAGASFAGADMRDFAFRCTILLYQACGNNENADFSGVDFTRADLSTLPIWGYDRFAGARFDRTWLAPQAIAHLDGVEPLGEVWLPARHDEEGNPGEPIALSPAEVAQVVADNAVASEDEPSFACAAAASRVEKLICGDWEQQARSLDRDLAALYREARAAGATDAAAQRAWLRQRDRCEDRECLAESYRARMDVLFAALGDRWALAPDETRAFHEPVLALTDAFRAGDLYRRMIPALELAAMQHATLTGRENGSIGAEGSALGANAHMCTLAVEAAEFDPANGWYSAVSSEGTTVPLFRIWGDRLMIRYSGNFGNTPEEAMDFISCGARAGFGDMLDLDGRE